jgi:hypothetical protein
VSGYAFLKPPIAINSFEAAIRSGVPRNWYVWSMSLRVGRTMSEHRGSLMSGILSSQTSHYHRCSLKSPSLTRIRLSDAQAAQAALSRSQLLKPLSDLSRSQSLSVAHAAKCTTITTRISNISEVFIKRTTEANEEREAIAKEREERVKRGSGKTGKRAINIIMQTLLTTKPVVVSAFIMLYMAENALVAG